MKELFISNPSKLSVMGTDKSIIVSFCSVTASQLRHSVDEAVTPSNS